MARKTNLTLNEILFEVMENLTDKDIAGEELDAYIRRADAAAKVAQKILDGKNLALRATLAAIDRGIQLPKAKDDLRLLTE